MACDMRQALIWPAELWRQLESPAQQQQGAGSNHWLFWQQMSSVAQAKMPPIAPNLYMLLALVLLSAATKPIWSRWQWWSSIQPVKNLTLATSSAICSFDRSSGDLLNVELSPEKDGFNKSQLLFVRIQMWWNIRSIVHVLLVCFHTVEQSTDLRW